jgi:hypothetical protein
VCQWQVAGLRDGLVRRLRNRVRVSQAFVAVDAGAQELLQFCTVEAEKLEVEIRALQVFQFQRQQFHVPFGDLREPVVREAVRLDLRRRQVLGHVDRHLGQAELLRCLPPRVPDDDDALGVNNDGLAKPELADARGHGVHRLVVHARVLLVRLDVRQLAHLDLHALVSLARWALSSRAKSSSTR